MKSKLLIILFLCFKDLYAGTFENINGIGIVAANFKGFSIVLCDTISETQIAARTYYPETRYYPDSSETYPAYSDSVVRILNPSRIYFYDMLVMRCIDKQGDWYKVRIKNEKEYWVKNNLREIKISKGEMRIEPQFEFFSWDSFAARTIWVNRMNGELNPIRETPTENGKVIKFTEKECLTAIEVKGNWLKITPSTGENCFGNEKHAGDDSFYRKKYFDFGWIKWRDDKNFLIRTTYR
jgi:hypothetical protein